MSFSTGSGRSSSADGFGAPASGRLNRLTVQSGLHLGRLSCLVLPKRYSRLESSRYCSRSRDSASLHMRMHVPTVVAPGVAVAQGTAAAAAASRCWSEAPLGA